MGNIMIVMRVLHLFDLEAGLVIESSTWGFDILAPSPNLEN